MHSALWLRMSHISAVSAISASTVYIFLNIIRSIVWYTLSICVSLFDIQLKVLFFLIFPTCHHRRRSSFRPIPSLTLPPPFPPPASSLFLPQWEVASALCHICRISFPRTSPLSSPPLVPPPPPPRFTPSTPLAAWFDELNRIISPLSHLGLHIWAH